MAADPLSRRVARGYILALATSLLVAMGRVALQSVLGETVTFTPFVLAVMISAWYGGLRPGLAATGLSTLLAVYLFIPPLYTLRITTAREAIGCVIFVVTGVCVSALSERLHRSSRRLEAERESRRLSEERERRRAHEMDTVLVNMEEGLYTVDTGGLVTYVNPAAERLLGRSAAELLGRKMHDVVHHSHPDGRPFPAEECAGLRVLRDGVSLVGHEDVFIRRDGSFFPIVLSSSRLVSDGSVAGVVVVFRDITESKSAERELREADHRKDEFLATLAHELRNPLAPIRHAVAILDLKDAPAAETRRARGVVDRQVRQMGRLVDDLLDVSRISRDRLVLRRETVDIAAVVADAVETVRPAIEEHGHTLTLALPDRPILVDADAVRLAQVFTNLLSNAAKFTDPGGWIAITAAESGGEASISVRDNGIGIPIDQQARVFEPFARIDRSLERTRSGLGVGLTLAGKIVGLHGGRIAVRSEGPGRGSEFVVTLRTQASPAASPGPVAAVARDAHRIAPVGHRRILIADDNADAADCLASLLTIAGCECRAVYDGLGALEVSRSFAPDIAFLDIGMPGMNGYDVAAALRRLRGRGVILIALTGWGQTEDKRRAFEAGFDHHLVKPIDPTSLLDLVRSLPTRGGAPENAAGSIGKPADVVSDRAPDPRVRPEG